MVTLTASPEKRVPLAVGPCCDKNLDSTGEQLMSAAGSLGYETQGNHRAASLPTSGPKGAYVVVCEYTPSPSDDLMELV